jgi:PTS system nitrogen regulatory IIA component
VRNPILLHVPGPFISLFLLDHPVDFDSIDGEPVFAVFLVVSETVPAHLRSLAQLGFLLRDPALRNLLRARAADDAILARIRELEPTTTGTFPARRKDS